MEKTNYRSWCFADLSPEEQHMVSGGTSFAYDVGRVLRFLGIAAGGVQGTSFAIVDWVGTSFLEE